MSSEHAEDIEDRVILRGEAVYNGCGSIQEIIDQLESRAERLRELDEEGYRVAPVFGASCEVELWKDGRDKSKDEVFEEVVEQEERLEEADSTP